ncbi:hypothetical protein DFQ26_004136 [Actinomortierella ambigua]|nr:hypothetical protein DFQ26_004136 [Actinomortierella ambigua]
MHLTIDEENALKAYLAPELDRLCDADPTMLADYIVALVKNDKLSGDTEDRVQHELADFMGPNIDSFATTFARVLNSKSYMPKSRSTKVSDPPASSTSASSPTPSSSSSSSRRPTTTLDSADMDASSGDRYGSSKHRRGDSDGSDDEDRSYKHVRRSNDDRYQYRGGSGSAPGGGGGGERGGEARSNYSPSNPTGDDRAMPSNSYDGRRRRLSNDANSNDVVGVGAGPYQHAGAGRTFDRRSGGMGVMGNMPPREAPIMTSGYRQREGLDQQQQQHHNGHGGGGGGGHHGFGRDQWNNHNNGNGVFGNDWQNQSRDETTGFRGRGGAPGGGGMGFGQERRRPRCRDYDQKGYCMRGDQCPYDHGDDRIVVDELPRMPFDMMAGGRPGNGPPMMHGNMPGMPGMDGNPAAPQFYGQGQVHDPSMMGGAGAGTHPHMEGGMAGRGGMGMGMGMGMRGARGASRGMRGGGRGRSSPYGSGGSGSGSTGGPGRFAGAVGNKERNQLVVENIPQEFNTIDQVNNYFKKFGPLSNIQVDQIARKALIQYATHEEAHAAYSSPEVIFNNRFVKVYWLPEDQHGTIVNTTLPPGGVGRGRGGPGGLGGGGHSSGAAGAAAAAAAAGGGAGGGPGSLSTGKPSGPPNTTAPPVLTPATAVFMTAEKAAELEAQRAATLAKQKQMEDIQKQKELLAQRQQEVQKQMMEKVLNNKNISQEDKDAILKGLKTVAVEVTKDPIVPAYHAAHHHHTAQAHANLVASVDPQKRLELLKEAERLEKERLDRELDAMTKGGADGAAGATGSETSASQADGKSSDAGTTAAATTTSEGAETTAALKAKLAALQAQAAAMGLDAHTGGYAPRGRGGFVPRGRGRGAMTWTRGSGSGSSTPGSAPPAAGALAAAAGGGGGVGGGGAPYRAFNLDMRNTKVSVQQLEPGMANEEALREHFQKFGELESVQVAADGQSATLHFKVRKEAEMALQQGARLADGHMLKLGWATAAGGPAGFTSSSSVAPLTTSITSTSASTVAAATMAAAGVTTTGAAAMSAGVVGPTSTTGPVVTSAPGLTAATSADDAHADLEDLAYHEDSEDEERSWKR